MLAIIDLRGAARLEIGITIAGGANVIAGRTHAGMSKARPSLHRTHQRGDVGKTLSRRARHGVVFGLADKIAVVGTARCRFDQPEAVRANQRVQEAYLGSHVADAQVGAH